jgi:hypothetical protein
VASKRTVIGRPCVCSVAYSRLASKRAGSVIGVPAYPVAAQNARYAGTAAYVIPLTSASEPTVYSTSVRLRLARSAYRRSRAARACSAPEGPDVGGVEKARRNACGGEGWRTARAGAQARRKRRDMVTRREMR